MKRILTLLVALIVISACNEQITTTTKIKMDSLGEKVEEGAKKAWDSTKADAEALKEKIEHKIENLKDSVQVRKDSANRKNK